MAFPTSIREKERRKGGVRCRYPALYDYPVFYSLESLRLFTDFLQFLLLLCLLLRQTA